VVSGGLRNYKKEYPEIGLIFQPEGREGMADAQRTVDLGMVSRGISQERKNKGVWWVSLTIDAVLPTISSENPFLEKFKKTRTGPVKNLKAFLSTNP